MQTTNHGSEPSFSDWAGFVAFRPELYFRPRDWDELRGFLGAIAQGLFQGRTLRVLGSLHSCSEICVSDWIVDVNDLPKSIEFSSDCTLVTASANWRLHDFLLALSAQGKSLSATGGTDAQTLAGLISTSVAPATSRHGLFDLLEWVEYLTIDEADQVVVEKHVARGDPAFPAVVGSLGAIGILTRVQFRLIDEPYFETIQKMVRLDEVLSDLDGTSQKYDFWRIDWLPDMDKGLLWAATRIAHADPAGDYPTDHAENILKVVCKFLDTVDSSAPRLNERLKIVYAGLELTYGETKVRGPLRNMLPVDRHTPLHVAMAEWSFNPGDLHKVMDCCRQYFRQAGWPNLPIEIELTKTDDGFMSPWNWPGLDYIVKLNFMYLTDVAATEARRHEILTHLQGLWDYLAQAGIQFKAHWGKINFMDASFVQDHYQFERFKPFICRAFVNRYLADRLPMTL